MPMEAVAKLQQAAESIATQSADHARAQALAKRIWDGQSPDTLNRPERLERIRKALEAQGLSMEGVQL